FVELGARQRAKALLDAGSYRELIDPFQRLCGLAGVFGHGQQCRIRLMLTSILCEVLMVWLGIGVKVATLPVIALGVG
ncbi:hypothetical protein Q6304_31005, partial [Klebsiella pneumoniae]|nr:hypothetical protein [Klebsiella pneumoniae]